MVNRTEGKMNWRFIGGIATGLFSVIVGVVEVIDSPEFIGRLGGEIMIGAGGAFLALVTISGWRQAQRADQSSRPPN
jgi:hypothetical protein